MFLFNPSKKIDVNDVSDSQRRILTDIVTEMVKHFPIDAMLDIPYTTSYMHTCNYCPFKEKCEAMNDDEKLASTCKERLYMFTKEE